MKSSYNFSVLQFSAHPLRDERLNVGLAIFSDGDLDIRLPRRLDKLQAISPSLDLDILRESLVNLRTLDEHFRQQESVSLEGRVSFLESTSVAKFSGRGVFSAINLPSYEDEVLKLFKALVEPEPLIPVQRKKRSKLLTFIKSEFKKERILAKKGEGISEHRVVPNVKIAEGLEADLVLKNGAMHVIETVDATDSDSSIRRIVSDIAVAALVLEQARMTFGADNTKSRLVYEAATNVESIAMPSLEAAAHQGAELYNWASAQDRERFISAISALAIPYEVAKRGRGATLIHASTQERLKIN